MRSDQRLIMPMRLLWTQKSTTALFFGGTGPIKTAALRYARATQVELMAPSDEALAVPGYQLCNDPSLESNWGTTTQLGGGGFLNVADITYNSTWVDIASAIAAARFVRFGFLAKNNTGTAIEHVLAGFIIDLRWE